MWKIEENINLIEAVQRHMANIHPIQSLENYQLDIICDWDIVSTRISKRSGDECKQQWRNLVRQYLYITNQMNTYASGPAVFDIDWRSMEQMAFLYKRYLFYFSTIISIFPNTKNLTESHLSHFYRFEQSMEESNKEDSIETVTASENDLFDDDNNRPVSPDVLKRWIQIILRSKPQPEYAIELRNKCDNFYAVESTGYCKVAKMIEIETADWSESERTNILVWYYETLTKIIKAYTSR